MSSGKGDNVNRTLQSSWLSHPKYNKKIKAAWERFQSGEAYAPSIALRPTIDDSWRRCLVSGVDPSRNPARVAVDSIGLQLLRKRHERLVSASAPFMVQSRSLLAQTGTVMVLTDPHGMVLDVEGDQRMRDAIERIRLIPGACWNEAVVGTNAIGTALQLRQPIQVHASEHFCEEIQTWSCSAAVIRDPVDGAVLGVLDISGRYATCNPHSLPLAAMTAEMIENQLAQRERERRVLLLESTMQRLSSGDGVIIFDGRGNLVRANDRAAPALAEWGVTLSTNTHMPAPRPDDAPPLPDVLPDRLLENRVEPVFRGSELLGFVASIPFRSGASAPAIMVEACAPRSRALTPEQREALLIRSICTRTDEMAGPREAGNTPAPTIDEDATEEGVLVTDADARIVTVNAAFTRITGYTIEDVAGKSPSILKSGLHSKEFYERMWRSLAERGRWQGEIQNRRKNGEIYPEWLTIYSIKGPRGEIQNHIAIFGDSSAASTAQEHLEFMQGHDALTGLPNRRLLMERLKECVDEAARIGDPLAVMLIGLDNFGDINDSLGHDLGDRLFQQVTERLRRCLCDAHTIARLGDEEFAVVMRGAAAEELHRVAANTLDYLSASFCVGHKELFVTTSIGISLFPADGDSGAVLLRNADRALHTAREGGRNRYQFFAEEMNVRLLQRMALEAGLRAAIEHDRFRVVFQPQDDLFTGAIVGAEALLRWTDPTLGEVSAARFIPVAEEAGLIVAVGDIVLAKVLAHIALWRRQGLVLPRISINIAAQQLREPRFVEHVCELLEEQGVPPEAICLELTEGTLMADLDKTGEILTRITERGIAVSIDDFGTGYSSLSYLSRLPIQELKVDQSFIRTIADEAGNRSITTAIIDMAHALGMTVLAEGVETGAQLQILKDKRCELGQGYYFHRPLSAAAFETLLVDSGGQFGHAEKKDTGFDFPLLH